MKKHRFTPVLPFVIVGLGLLLILALIAARPAQDSLLVTCSPVQMEPVKASGLIWESLSRQFISTVGAY